MRSCSDTDINPLSLYSRERGKKNKLSYYGMTFFVFLMRHYFQNCKQGVGDNQ